MTDDQQDGLDHTTLATARQQLAELHAVIEQELAGVRDRIADLQRHEATARRIREEARELLRLGPTPGEE